MPLLAHAGHWAVYVLYAVPVLIVLTAVAFAVIRDRRAGPDEQDVERPKASNGGTESAARPEDA